MSHLPPPPERPLRRRVAALAALTLASAALAASPAVAAPPPNDAFANATEITLDGSGNGGTANGDTSNATREPGEPVIRDETSGSAWYRITSPVARALTLDTCSDASFDTMLGVYTGTVVAALTVVANNDDGGSHSGCPSYRSRVTFVAQANVTYFVQVDGYNTGAGTFALRTAAATELPAPDIEPWFQYAFNPHVDRPILGDFSSPAAVTTCTLDGGSGRPCALPYLVPTGSALSDGEHVLTAQQAVGSLVSPLATLSFWIDTAAPTTQIVAGPGDGAALSSFPATWTVTTSEAGISLSCVIDGIPSECTASNAGQPMRFTVTVPQLCNGSHTIAVAAKDEARNQGPPSDTRTFTVSDGPECVAPTFDATPTVVDTEPTQADVDVDLWGGSAATRQYIEYGPDYRWRGGEEPLGVDHGDATVRLDFLTPGTTYPARWVLENRAGRKVSASFTITTPAARGSEIRLTSMPVTGRTETTATLNGSTPTDRGTTARFEYGTSTSYGSVTPESRGAGPIAATLTGLLPRTTYHYRLVAVSKETRSVTPDATFTTGPDPVVEAPPVESPQVKPPPSQPITPAGTAEAPHPLTDRITQDLRKALRAVKLNRKGLRKGTKPTFKLTTRTSGVTRLSSSLRRGKSKKSITVGTAKKANKTPTKKANTVVLKLPVSTKAKSAAKRKGKLTVTLKAQFTPGGTKQTITVTRKVTVK